MQVKYKYTEKQESGGLYPSTNYTCIDTQEAIKELSWSPSPLVIAV